MTEHEQTLEALESLKAEVQQLRLVITGDKLHQQPGLVDILDSHNRELYGDQATQHIGLKEQQERNHRRIEALEGDRAKLLAVCAAISSLVGIVWILVKQFILK